MAKIRSDLSNWFILILLVIHTKCSSAELKSNEDGIDLKFIDFEQIKYNLFTGNVSGEFENGNLSPKDRRCLFELDAIKKEFNSKRPKLWALKSNFSFQIFRS